MVLEMQNKDVTSHQLSIVYVMFICTCTHHILWSTWKRQENRYNRVYNSKIMTVRKLKHVALDKEEVGRINYLTARRFWIIDLAETLGSTGAPLCLNSYIGRA